MPKKFPPEFKRDVVAVARRGDLKINELAADFDVAPETVRRWVRQADIDDGVRDGLSSAEQAAIVQLRRANRRLGMRTRCCAAPPRTLRRTHSPNDVPAGP